MKQLIIIFTRIDGDTREYFKNFFPEFNENESWWNFNISKKYDLFFILDKTVHEINELNNLWKYSYKNSDPWIFLHKGKNNVAQQKWLTNIFQRYSFYTTEQNTITGDHHNDDGCHYQKILNAASSYHSNDIAMMDFHFETLNKCLNN